MWQVLSEHLTKINAVMTFHLFNIHFGFELERVLLKMYWIKLNQSINESMNERLQLIKTKCQGKYANASLRFLMAPHVCLGKRFQVIAAGIHEVYFKNVYNQVWVNSKLWTTDLPRILLAAHPI